MRRHTPSPGAVQIARAFFLALCCFLGIAVSRGLERAAWEGAIAGTGFAAVLIFFDSFLNRFTIRGFSAGTFGLGVGLFCAWLVTRAGMLDLPWLTDRPDAATWKSVFQLVINLSFGFLGVTLALRSDRQHFSLVIPYVRFRQDAAHDIPLLLDTNAIIDGRVPKLCDCGFVTGPMVVPQLVLEELHQLADSNDAIRSERGRRGLENLAQMKTRKDFELEIYDGYMGEPEDRADTKIIQLARQLGAKIVTNDQNLGRVARLRGMHVLHLSELAAAVRQELRPGDEMEIVLARKGREEHQAIGHLPDGTMIVVNGASGKIGENVEVVISGATHTTAGRLVFADLKLHLPLPAELRATLVKATSA